MDKRPKIAFQITNLLEEYPKNLIRGAYSAAKEVNIDLFIFPSEALNISHEYRYQSNLLFNLVNDNNFDVIILSTGTLCNYVGQEEFKFLITKNKNKPLISIGIDIEGTFSITVENKEGIKEAIKHLVNVHNKKTIGFIKGPENNPEAIERLEAYLEEIKAQGLKICEELIFDGDFLLESGEKVADQILNKQIWPEAIIASNDNMALGLVRKLKEKGIKIPEEIAVVGFDDSFESKSSIPNISSIKQPIFKQGYIAVKTAYEFFLHGFKPGNIKLPTYFIARESCGCKEENKIMSFPISKENLLREIKNLFEIEDIDFEIYEKIITLFNNIIENVDKLEKLYADILKKLIEILKIINLKDEDILVFNKAFDIITNTLQKDQLIISKLKEEVYRFYVRIEKQKEKELSIYRNKIRTAMALLYTSSSLTEWLSNVLNLVKSLKYSSFYLIKFSEPIFHKKNDKFPENLSTSLVLAKKNRFKIITFEGIKKDFHSLIKEISTEDKKLFIISIIYFMDYIYGYAIVEANILEAINLEDILVNLSRSLFTVRTLEKLRLDKELLYQYKLHIEKEIELAKLLQKNLIPESSPKPYISFFYKYKEKVGGDFFNFISFREKDWTGIFIADVSGHGVPTALITSALRSSILQLREFLIYPSSFLMELNETIFSMTEEGFFVTAFYGIYKENEKKLVFANAGHNLPFLISESEVLKIDSKSEGVALGILSKEEMLQKGKEYKEELVNLENYKKIIFYTDGLVETTMKNNPNIDFENFLLKKVFLQNKNLPAGQFLEKIIQEATRFHGNNELEDDVTLICIDLT